MKGKNRCDLTQLLSNPSVFQSLIVEMTKPFLSKGISRVVALDAMGFALGGAIAHLLKAGLVLARKGGKSAWKVKNIEFLDYSHQKKKLEIVEDALKPDDKVLIVDDWSETGTQLKASVKLVEQLGSIIVGISCINIDPSVKNDDKLKKYELCALI